jgi:hypothetical protein
MEGANVHGHPGLTGVMMRRSAARRLRDISILAAILVLFAVACRPTAAIRQVEVRATDYAFALPTTLPAGRTAFRLVNAGTVWHEVQIFRFRPGIDPTVAARLLAADSLPDAVRDSTGSVLIAGAGMGSNQEILTTLAPGELYGFLCEFRDSTAKSKHATLGMFALVHVE